jgi:hypothetical protein
MAKARKRIAARKKSSKPGKATTKPARKNKAKRTPAKNSKFKVRRVGTKDKEPLQSLTGFVEQTAEQITERTQGKDQEPFESLSQTAEQITEQTKGAMENYFNWFQNAMSALPWGSTNLNRILVSHATQNVTATFAFVQKLSQAKNFQDVVKIQTQFMNAQLNSFNDQAKIIGEIYTNAAAATKIPFSVST